MGQNYQTLETTNFGHMSMALNHGSRKYILHGRPDIGYVSDHPLGNYDEDSYTVAFKAYPDPDKDESMILADFNVSAGENDGRPSRQLKEGTLLQLLAELGRTVSDPDADAEKKAMTSGAINGLHQKCMPGINGNDTHFIVVGGGDHKYKLECRKNDTAMPRRSGPDITYEVYDFHIEPIDPSDKLSALAYSCRFDENAKPLSSEDKAVFTCRFQSDVPEGAPLHIAFYYGLETGQREMKSRAAAYSREHGDDGHAAEMVDRFGGMSKYMKEVQPGFADFGRYPSPPECVREPIVESRSETGYESARKSAYERMLGMRGDGRIRDHGEAEREDGGYGMDM